MILKFAVFPHESEFWNFALRRLFLRISSDIKNRLNLKQAKMTFLRKPKGKSWYLSDRHEMPEWLCRPMHHQLLPYAIGRSCCKKGTLQNVSQHVPFEASRIFPLSGSPQLCFCSHHPKQYCCRNPNSKEQSLHSTGSESDH